MTLPIEVITVIEGAIAYVVALIIGAVADYAKVDLSEFAAGIIAVVSQVALAFFSGILVQLPANYVTLGLTVLVAVLGFLGQKATRERHIAANRQLKLGTFRAKK